MRYKVFTRADLLCPFRAGGIIPDKYKLSESFAKKFCGKGCCLVCSPLFWWVRVLKKNEEAAPWMELTELVIDPKKIILLPMEGKV